MILPLQTGTLYGPIRSRRYGLSLGINLSPCNYKLCSFNCVYCHYGLTDKVTFDVSKYSEDLPEHDEVIRVLEEKLQSSLELDLITFSGNGEPTVYPGFSELVDAVIKLRNKYQPKARIALLSNATGLLRPEVRKAIAKIDLPVLKLDAGTPGTFLSINRPARGVSFEDITTHLSTMKNIYLQTVLIDGFPSNASSNELAAYFSLLRRIGPREVHVYSIDRPVPDKRITLVMPDRLKAVADQVRHEVGVCVKVFHR